jgi:competence protein ComEC
MDSGKKQLFRDGGLSWLVCVSSLHISLIGMAVYRFLRGRRLPFAAAGAAAFVLALCYVFLTGFSVSSQRALAVFLIWLGAQVFGRTQDSLSALSVAAVWILFRQPAALWDSSFVLSCVCILSSEYVTPAFSRILRPRFSWHRSLAGSFSLYIGSLPAVLWFFYQTTPYTFLMYPVMVVLVMLTLCFSLAGSMLGYLFFQTGQAMFVPNTALTKPLLQLSYHARLC